VVALDYLIRSNQELLIIEAKKGDLDKGFNQLSAQLIALDKYDEDSDFGNMSLAGRGLQPRPKRFFEGIKNRGNT
jgi:hypothetical protein